MPSPVRQVPAGLGPGSGTGPGIPAPSIFDGAGDGTGPRGGSRPSLVQDDPYGRGKDFVDIKFTFPFQYKPLVLKRHFKIAVNKNHSTTIRVTLYLILDFYLFIQLLYK